MYMYINGKMITQNGILKESVNAKQLEPGTCRVLGECPQLHARGGAV